MKLIFSIDLKPRLTAVLGLTQKEIEECFLNRTSAFEQSTLDDSTIKNFSFVSKTDRGCVLKIEFNIKDKLLHILHLPDKRTVTMEQEGVFCEVTCVKRIIKQKLVTKT